MATVTAADLAALAEALTQATADVAKTAASIERHVTAKAKEIGDARGVEYAKTAKEQIAAAEKAAAVEIQRRNDVIAELRIQLELQARRAHAGRVLKDRVFELARMAGERGEGVPADVLKQALAEAQAAERQDHHQTAPEKARNNQENEP